MPRGGEQLEDLVTFGGGIADDRGMVLLELEQVGAVQRHVDLVEGPARDQPLPVGLGPVEGTEAAGAILGVDPREGAQLHAAPEPNVQPALAAVQAHAFEPGEQVARGRPGTAVAAAEGPALAAEEVGRAGPKQAHQGPVGGHPRFGGSQQIAATAAAAELGQHAQTVQAGHGQIERAELHDPTGQVDMPDNARTALGQQSVVRLVIRVFQRGAKLLPRRTLEHGGEEAMDRRIVGRGGGGNPKPDGRHASRFRASRFRASRFCASLRRRLATAVRTKPLRTRDACIHRLESLQGTTNDPSRVFGMQAGSV